MWKRLKSGIKTRPPDGSPDRSDKGSTTSPPSESAGIAHRPRQSSTPKTFPRRESEQSAISDFNAQLRPDVPVARQRARSRDRREDPLGLVVLHSPGSAERKVDIIFIHGLGGTSLRTWCFNRDLDYLWPQAWLSSSEHGLSSAARILTFGYNAHFSSSTEQAALTIGDFANDLLFRMKYGEAGEERLGQRPIIIVAHSMGGLVFKKAYAQGQLNDEFRDVISSIRAVLFLATPHRGTDLAKTLNKILTNSVFGHSPKDYVSELAKRSPTIDDLNESFRHHASKLQIFSFYETLTTPVGPISTMILDKHSAVLGYPNETPQPLVANHHEVCKFRDPQDPNYLSILGALRSVVDKCCRTPDDTASEVAEDLRQVQLLLQVSGAPEEDLAAGLAVRKDGTGEHFINSSEFCTWLQPDALNNDGKGSILWAHAPPGNGKSTICALTIKRLQEQNRRCVYFFFKHGTRQKQLLGTMFRSLAFQIAEQLPSARRVLVELAESGLKLQMSGISGIWKGVFQSCLSELPSEETLYWVIDGLDECESPRDAIDLLSSAAADFNMKPRILIFSRAQPTISRAIQKARRKTPIDEVALAGSANDIQALAEEEVEDLPCEEDFKTTVVKQITTRAQGNFLWASLVLKEVVRCHRQEQVTRVLETTPDGMGQLYDRMLDTLDTLDMKEDRALAKLMLSWAMYSKAPVSVEQLLELYTAQLKPIMDIKHTVNEVCGQLVVITPHGNVTLVHHSARQYLQDSTRHGFLLKSEECHEEILGRCLVTLCDKNLRAKISALKVPLFLPYAATSWAFHLDECSAASDRILDGLVRFLGGPSILTWIHYLAMRGGLSEMFGVSHRLTTYIKRRRKVEADRPPMRHRIRDLALLESWTVDLIKIPAKFATHLSQDPLLIYKSIAPLCPNKSAIATQFGGAASDNELSIKGVSNDEWDDCLARVSAGSGRSMRVATSTLYLAVASDVPKGSITVWDTTLLQEHISFNVGQRVLFLCFNDAGSLMACNSISKTFVWKIKDGSCLLEIKNPPRQRAIEFQFAPDDSLYMVTDIRQVFSSKMATLDSGKPPSWTRLDPSLLQQAGPQEEGSWLGTPTSAAFNPDCTQVAVAYRASPLSIWNLDPPHVIAWMKRKPGQGEGSVNSHTGDNKVTWHPSGSYVLGIYGQIFRWNPTDDSYETVKGSTGVVPHDIQCSPNGLVFITGDVEGSIKIYEVSSMTLIYRLTSEDRINRICFSPSSDRFYDLRGSYCNIWEPNCLMRLADAATERWQDSDSSVDSFWTDRDDTDARSTSLSFLVSEKHTESKPAVSIVAHEGDPRMVAYARQDGSLDVYDPSLFLDTEFDIVQPTFGVGVEAVAWDSRQRCLAYCLSRVVTVKRIEASIGDNSVTCTDFFNEGSDNINGRGRGMVRQLIFDSTDELLFIAGAQACQVINIKTNIKLAEIASPTGGCWHRHPSEPDTLLFTTMATTTAYGWDLKEMQSSETGVDGDSSPSPVIVDSPLPSYSSEFLLFRTTTTGAGRSHWGFHVYRVSEEGNPSDDDSSSPSRLQGLDIPSSIRERIKYPAGILKDGRLVFLDGNLFVCTVSLHRIRSSPLITRHFFIPQDWMTSEVLRLCSVRSDGTFLCPTKGRVAVIKSELVSGW